MSILDTIFFGPDYSAEDNGAATFAEGTITSVGTDGIIFTVEAFDGGVHSWGPAPYPLWTASATSQLAGPAAGYRCLVLFPQGTTMNPWVIGWWPT